MYKKGLVFGKFMPIHNGHLALINFALQQCESLIVSMSYKPNEPIDPDLRFTWLQKLFADKPNIELALVLDDFDDADLPLFEATKIWADFIKNRFPDITVFFCSEDYGAPLSFHLGLPCVVFDQKRTNLPVSATKIRTEPLVYWNDIPSVVRPYFVKKICLYGPESTGKSTLARDLAQHFETEFAPEVAREILTDNDFTMADILRIGYAQIAAVEAKLQTANKFIFCDTDTITTQIYAKHYLNDVPEELYTLEKSVHYDLYCLLDIDVPWVADELRDLGDKRIEMYQIFKENLEKRGILYLKVSGNWAERKRKIIDVLKHRLNG
jgi:HTH-type transcriptional regulator, transcriptional repressor of NAD biosynthesis genes